METADPMLNRRIGPYRLTRRLGEGGMGVVYLAEREDEFRQRVAIKLVRFAAESPEVAARLRTERQTLAALHHPSIVSLLDGGATEDGLPYLVMEYVEGTPIDEYCTAHHLDIQARLRLFLQVCSAVQCAHQNMVLHCDLKPGNILVTEDGTPKLLDFGIAKLLTPQASTMTVGGQRPFTPRYASPEQFLGKPLTAATDVYALGMTLFHLLTGGSPYRFQTHSDAELISAVCLQEPQRPSSSTTAPYARDLTGDLDAILLKALRKEPENRYSSAEHLADDIRRHLDGRPVTAHQGSFRYRTTKFVLRNRIAVGAGSFALLAMLVGAAGMVWQASIAIRAKSRAEHRFNDVRQLANFLLFDFHDAVQKLPGSTPVQEMLVRRSLGYLDSLARESSGDPELEVELVEAYLRLGDVQGNPYNENLGDAAGALASYRKALAIAEPLARSESRNRRVVRALARTHAHLADVLFLNRNMKESISNTRQATEAFQKLVDAEPSDVDAHIDLAAGCEALGDQLNRGMRDTPAALAAYRKSLAQWEAVVALNRTHTRALRAVPGLNMKIAAIEMASDARAALARLERARTALDVLPAAERSSVGVRRLNASILQRIADCQWELNDVAGTVESYRKATEAFSALATLDPSNARAQFDFVVVLNNSGLTFEAAGDLAGALHSYAQVADILERLVKLDPENPSWRAHLAESLVHIGSLLDRTGQSGEARRQTVRGIAAAKQLADNPSAPASELVRAARVLVICNPADLRDPRAAVRYVQRALDLTKTADAYTLDTLAEAQIGMGDKAAAGETLKKALALTGPDQPAPSVRRSLEAKLERLKP